MIQLDKYIFTMKMWKEQIAVFRNNPEVAEGIDKSIETDVFRVFWGGIQYPTAPSCVIETGFFWNAAHLDTVGLYHQSALCTPQAIKEIDSFNALISAEDILKSQKQKSKYQQGEDSNVKDKDIHWPGIVLALQNPRDRSVRSVASPEDYFKFVEDACKFYGKNLYIKLHPWNSDDAGERLRKIAYDNGVPAAKINHRIIENCEFVLVYNSTFSVDCMMRGVPVAQYAPGYFWQNPAVKYTKGEFPNQIKTDISFGHKTCDFLMGKYCFDYTMSGNDWIDMFKAISKSRDTFPIPEEFCYARNKMRA